MGTIKTTNIETITGSGTLTLGQSGETITIPSGVTMSVPSGGLSGQNYPAFEATLTSNQTISNNTATKVQFNNEIFDTNSNYDPTTNYRFTASESGKYFIYSSLTLAGVNNREHEIYFAIRKNNSEVRRIITSEDLTQSTCVGVNLSTIVSLSATDYVEIFITQADYTTLGTMNVLNTISSVFGGFRLGA